MWCGINICTVFTYRTIASNSHIPQQTRNELELIWKSIYGISQPCSLKLTSTRIITNTILSMLMMLSIMGIPSSYGIHHSCPISISDFSMWSKQRIHYTSHPTCSCNMKYHILLWPMTFCPKQNLYIYICSYTLFQYWSGPLTRSIYYHRRHQVAGLILGRFDRSIYWWDCFMSIFDLEDGSRQRLIDWSRSELCYESKNLEIKTTHTHNSVKD